ncbi:AAA family ATPase [Nocardiopsis alba]|uniref:AAA family ATPase n=1 Tax=Nocardiopsis alba TaxID=53437 RepID=UPI0035E02264
MSRIVSFEIKGLAGSRKIFRHEMDPSVNVFWGVNGTGKTSLLKILHSALLNDVTPLYRVPFTSAIVKIKDRTSTFERYINKSSLEENRIEQLALSDAIENTYTRYAEINQRSYMEQSGRGKTSWESNTKNPFSVRPNRHGYLPISRISESRARKGRYRPAGELIDEASFDRLFAEQIQRLWQEYNQESLLNIRNTQQKGIAQILGSVLSAKSSGRKTQPVSDSEEAFLLMKEFISTQRFGRMMNISREEFIENYDSNPVVQEVVAEVAEVQQEVDKAQEPQKRIENLLSDLYGAGKKVELQGREVVVRQGNESVPLESLSSGQKQILQILIESLSAGSNPIIIDEPELSLHVDWQNKLIDCMQTVNPHAQVIVATHSPEIMAEISDEVITELG